MAYRMADIDSAAADHPLRRDMISGLLLLAAVPLLVAGLAMPAISITRLVLFRDTYSLTEAVFAFWQDGQYLLFVVVFVFSVLFPTAKIAISLSAWGFAGRDHARLMKVLVVTAAISKWSMLDVFIVALTVLVVEGSLLATADVHVGLVLFAASVILSTIATQRLGNLAHRAA